MLLVSADREVKMMNFEISALSTVKVIQIQTHLGPNYHGCNFALFQLSPSQAIFVNINSDKIPLLAMKPSLMENLKCSFPAISLREWVLTSLSLVGADLQVKVSCRFSSLKTLHVIQIPTHGQHD